MKLKAYFSLFFLGFISCNQNSGFESLSSINTLHSRSQFAESFTNGQLQQESFTLRNQRAKLDFVILPDASRSMFHRLNTLGSSLSDLLYVISDYDWQFGFTSTDHGDYRIKGPEDKWQDNTAKGYGRFGTLMSLEDGNRFLSSNILTEKISNYQSVFLQTLSHNSNIDCSKPPFCANPIEQPLRSLKSFIDRAYLDNRHFFREGADFVSLIITNEEERKEDRKRATTAQEVLNSFNRQFSHLNKKFIAYNIIIQDNNQGDRCLQEERDHNVAAHPAKSISHLALLTGGSNMNLCSTNYGSELRKISEHIKNSIENRVFLKQEPIPDTVQVSSVNGMPLDWRVFGRQLIFNNLPYGNISIDVSYEAK